MKSSLVKRHKALFGSLIGIMFVCLLLAGSAWSAPGCVEDADCDGLPDTWEMNHGTNPDLVDTDGDGRDDAFEVMHGLNPNGADTIAPLFLVITPCPFPYYCEANTVEANNVSFKIETNAVGIGSGVKVAIHRDFDGSGFIDDPDEIWPLASEVVGDNQAYEVEVFSNDSNVASKLITTYFTNLYGSSWVEPGFYIISVTDALGEIRTQQVEVVDPASPPAGSVSGTVTDGSNPVANAIVYLLVASGADQDDETLVSFAFTDSDGNYTISLPSPLPQPFLLVAVKQGLVPSNVQGGNLPSGTGVLPGQNLVMSQSYTFITGQVTDYFTNAPAANVPIFADINGFEVETLTDDYGNYTLPALAGVTSQVEAYRTPLYYAVRVDNTNLDWGTEITPTGSGPNIVNFKSFRTTSRFQVEARTERDSLPVVDANVSANLNNSSANGQGWTDPTGRSTVGVGTGEWNVGVNYDGQPQLVGEASKQGTADIGEDVPLSFTFYYRDGSISGNVVSNADPSIPRAGVEVQAETTEGFNGSDQTSVGALQAVAKTDNDGNFTLPVLSGTWQVQARDWENNMYSAVAMISVVTDGDEDVEPGESVSLSQALVLAYSQSWHCDNDVVDADETGTDCGGNSCAPCSGPVDSVTLVSTAPGTLFQKGPEILFTAEALGGFEPQYQFKLKNNLGVISEVQPYTAGDTTFSWPTAALTPGSYTIYVYAKSAASVAVFEKTKALSFTVVANDPVDSVTLVSTAPGTLFQKGPEILFTAEALGGFEPQYQFKLKNSLGVISEVQPYTTGDTTFSWPTADLTPGSYTIYVYVKSAASVAVFEKTKALAFTVVANDPVDSVTLVSTAPGAIFQAGPEILFSAEALGGVDPQYQFKLKDTLGVISEVKAYSTDGATFNWPTDGLAPGKYTIYVYVKSAGSVAVFEKSKALTFTLDGGPA